jgi:hypothetical protein
LGIWVFFLILSATTGFFLLAEKRGACESRSTTYAALHMDGVDRAIQLACAAFHAGLFIDKVGQPAIHFERGMWANIHTDAAPNAERLIIFKCVGCISI